MKANAKITTTLHNNLLLTVDKASNSQIEASIVWYRATLAEYPRQSLHGLVQAPARWIENLAVLEAERANRIGKK
jgi:hypothetical protein